LLVGASGLVGSALLKMLLASDAYARVWVLARRELALADARLTARVVEFERIAELQDFPAVDDVYCCLGTTIKAAGSRAAFRRVDLDYVAEFARAARREGATRLAVVSAMGADSRSSVFYNRVKGDMETVVRALDYASVTILRPSLLAGERAERRPGERVALAIAQPLSVLIPRRYRPIRASAVARAMLHFQLQGRPGARVIESDRLQDFVEPRT
jgi:uncharacterized protein YbjT (DUF2867 family)